VFQGCNSRKQDSADKPMPKPRQPLAKAIATGAVLKNPKRYRNRSEPQRLVPLGPPSAHLSKEAKRAFVAFKAELPWLAESDRALVDIAARLRAELWAGRLTVVNSLRLCLTQMGATPVDRGKMVVPPDDPADDPATEYIN
jgi:hypothetical protein